MKDRVCYLNRTLVISPYHIGLCVTEKAFQAEMRRLRVPRKNWPEWIGGTRSDATAHFFESDEQRLLAIVCIRPDKKLSREQTYALLAHEAVHVWQAIKEEIHEKTPSDEFEAWSIQSICLELFEGYLSAAKREKK